MLDILGSYDDPKQKILAIYENFLFCNKVLRAFFRFEFFT